MVVEVEVEPFVPETMHVERLHQPLIRREEALEVTEELGMLSRRRQQFFIQAAVEEEAVVTQRTL
jgi:hypothetical protein